MAQRVIRTQADVDDFARLLSGLAKPLTLEWTPGQDRSLEQNKLQFLWARETAEQLGDRTADEVRRSWKLHHGVPILREESPNFRLVYDQAIKPLTYEMKLLAMTFIPVTSEMKVRQMVRYLDTVQRETLQQGVRLTDPDPDLAAYHARYRTKDAA